MSNNLKKDIFVTPRARAYAKKMRIPTHELKGSGPCGRIIEQDVIHYVTVTSRIQPQETSQTFHPKKASPLAKRIADAEKIDLERIKGTGINGKIMSADLLHSVDRSSNHVDPKTIPMSGMRKIIANKMTESKRNAPHVTLMVKTDVTKLVKYRELWMQKENIKISFTDLLIKIVAKSLRQHPRINVSFEKENMIYHSDINIGVAVALEDGLVVPVIKNADQKSIIQISKNFKEKIEKAKSGKLTPTDLESGRMTISNLGMYDVDAFTPIINQPESAILGIGRIIEDVIIKNEQIRIGKTMTLSLSFDHRVMDGAPAAMFLGEIKKLIENPEEIM